MSDPLRDELLSIARAVEALKRECGMDPESPTAIQNGRYMGISYRLRALADRAPTGAAPEPAAVPIPVAAGRAIANNYGYDQVVIVARRIGGIEHVTTYGRDKAHCDVAARMGHFFKHKLMGWPAEAIESAIRSADRAPTGAAAAPQGATNTPSRAGGAQTGPLRHDDIADVVDFVLAGPPRREIERAIVKYAAERLATRS